MFSFQMGNLWSQGFIILVYIKRKTEAFVVVLTRIVNLKNTIFYFYLSNPSDIWKIIIVRDVKGMPDGATQLGPNFFDTF